MRTLTAGNPPTWTQLVMSLACTGVVPTPGNDEYVWLVWALHLQQRGELPERLSREFDLLPAAVRSLRHDAWVRRYLECAQRDFAGQPLTGGARTSWLSRQRIRHEAGSMLRGQVILLSMLKGFSWTPDADQWEAMYDEVRRYVSTVGTIPTRAKAPDLAGWLATQRFAMRHGRLNARRTQVLWLLPGFPESMQDERAEMVWRRRFDALRRQVCACGQFPSAGSARAEDQKLAQWVQTQRASYRRGDLGARRVTALESLPGWRWSTHASEFGTHLERLDVDTDIRPGHPMYRWTIAQRRRHRDGQLSPEQSTALDERRLLDENLQRTR